MHSAEGQQAYLRCRHVYILAVGLRGLASFGEFMEKAVFVASLAALGCILTVYVRYRWYDIQDWFGDMVNWGKEWRVQVLASLIGTHISRLQKAARDAGDKAGYARGLQDGKVIWDVHDHRLIPNPRELDSSVYGPERFRVTEHCRDQMRQEVEAAVAKELISRPSNDQWEMILSDHPSTCVLAGAGSGKSTTLALRIIFMLAHLGIRSEEMTVVSFTNDSCEDLREKLVRFGTHWPAIGMNKEVAADLVRTYHSALSRMAKSVFPHIKWFENIGREKEKAPKLNDNPFACSVNQDQVELVKRTYRKLYCDDGEFRRAVLAMAEIECTKDTVADASEGYQSHDWLIEVASKRDRELVDILNERWKEKGLWPINGVDPEPFIAFTVDGHPFYANGKVQRSGMAVFLGAGTEKDMWFSKTETIGEKYPLAVTRAIGVKRNMVSWRLSKDHAYLASRQALSSLALRIRHLDPESSIVEPPMFPVRLTGEKVYSELLAAFISQASFIESMGLEVTDFVQKMRPFRDADLDHHFCSALARFWPRFETDLRNNGIMTFNRGFSTLSDGLVDPEKRKQLTRLCQPLTHLLIDEFQDISLQLVTWIQNAHRLLAIGNKRPSIMAIGDDWQSIYGWRGSSPEFFVGFDRFFKVHPDLGASQQYPMGENFRSIPEIVDDGSVVLAPVGLKTQKPVFSKVKTDAGDHGVQITLQKGDEGDDAYIKRIAEQANDMYEQMQLRPNGDKRKLLVMARSNACLEAVQGHLGERPGLSFRTIHRAKGLQAEAAIICEDCTNEGPHPIRDRVYAMMKNFKCKSYEEAQRDEAHRLAYVAVTRGIRRVHWFAGKGQGASRLLNKDVN